MQIEKTDFLVIGSGIAGLVYALKVAALGKVTVLCKNMPTESSTRYAQGGIASVSSPLDSFQSHIQDTLDAGAGLCHEEIVELLVREGPIRVQELIDLGTNFDKNDTDGDYKLGQEGGHSVRRILHAGDATGAEIQRAILAEANSNPNIELLASHIAIDLITSNHTAENKEVIGAYVLDENSGAVKTFSAKNTMLATGGVGKVYLYTSNPVVATGDGIAMAYRAGAKIANMEFIQFHPTCLYHPQAHSFLITEAMRGEGAILKRSDGYCFMPDYHEKAELAPRDIVARAIDDQMKRFGDDYVYLDISHKSKDFIIDHFPTIYARLNELGIDCSKDPIPVVPAAHYCCGGVLSDRHGRTNLKRLYTAGETAWTGVHGANRLASNSLLEALVFAHRAADDARENVLPLPSPEVPEPWDNLGTGQSTEEVVVSHTWDEVRRTMWNLVGIVRSDSRLMLAQRRVSRAAEEIRDYYWKFRVTSDLIELRNLIQVADLIIRSASHRKESRGLHFTSDYPDRDDEHWNRDTILQQDQEST
jgi:L-aspartate oxidase